MDDRVAKLVVFFKSLKRRDSKTHTEFMVSVVPELADLLGYDPGQVFFDRFLGSTTMRADAVIALEPSTAPSVIIEIKYLSDPKVALHIYGKWEAQARQYSSTGKAPVLLVSPSTLILARDDKAHRFKTDTIDERDIRFLLAALGPDQQRTAELPPVLPPSADQPLDDSFLMSRGALRSRLDMVRSAVTAIEKGRVLEELAADLFASFPSLRVKYRNLQTVSSEIDAVVEFHAWPLPHPFREIGQYALIECKNWSEPVGAKHVRDFIAKMIATKIRVGFFFSSKGVTGTDSGVDALREIQRTYDTNNVCVVVITADDLEHIAANGGFLAMIDDRIDHLRFNVS